MFAGHRLNCDNHSICQLPTTWYLLKNFFKPLNAPAGISWLATVHSGAQVEDDTDNDAQMKLPFLHTALFIVGRHAENPAEDIQVIQIQLGISGKWYNKLVARSFFIILIIQDHSRVLNQTVKQVKHSYQLSII